MKTLTELKQERAAKVKAQSTMVTEARTANADFTEEQTRTFDADTATIEALDIQIARAIKMDEAEKRQADLDGKKIVEPSKGGEDAESRKIKSAASVSRAIRLVSKGIALDGAEKEMNEVAEAEARAAGITLSDEALLHIPMSMLRADAHTVTEDAGAYGGKLVHDQAPRVQMPFAPKTVLEKLGATRLSGLTGGDLPLPVGNNYDFSWLTETEEVPLQKQEFDGPVLSPKRLAAAVQVSNRLLMQSSVNVEGMIRQLLFAGYDRALSAAAINGAGGLAPTGLLNLAGVQQSTTTVAASATRAMLVELPALIEAANSSEDSLGWLMSPALKAILQNTKTDAGSGLFLMDANNNIMGYKTVSSTLVPQLAGNEALIFGDWSKVFIGEWGPMSILSNPYSAARKNSLELVVNGHADVAVAQPNAFSVNKFITA